MDIDYYGGYHFQFVYLPIADTWYCYVWRSNRFNFVIRSVNEVYAYNSFTLVA